MHRNRILVFWALLLGCGGSGSSGGTDDALPPFDVPTIDDIQYGDLDAVSKETCVPECENEGDRRCVHNVAGMFQVCELKDGCLVWGTAQQCPGGGICLDGECKTECISDYGCTKTGDRRCATATAYQECYEAAPGCYKYGEKKTCLGAAVCVGDGQCECQHRCELLDRRCFAAEPDLFQVCVEDVAGCRVFGQPESCGEAVCMGAGVCVDVCKSNCDEKGKKECASATAFRICEEAQPGCLKWSDLIDCPGDLICADGSCQVQCTSDPGCTAVGVRGCLDGMTARTCVEVAPGCLKWSELTTCPAHQTCTPVAGCTCINPCSLGDAKCLPEIDPGYVMACAKDQAGCTYWGYIDCGPSFVCDKGQCVQVCLSDPGCTAPGVTRCETYYSMAVCEEVPQQPSCIQYGPPQMCPEHQVCDLDTCRCRIEEGCTDVGLVRCVGYDYKSECKKDAYGCLYWDAPVACAFGTVCAGSDCSPVCSSDPDCTSVGISKCSSSNTIQTCVEVEPGCIKWSYPASCPEHQKCVDGACTCMETCQIGEKRCVTLNQYQTCDGPDPAGCSYWNPAQVCDGNKSCVLGECKEVSSPVVSCGEITLNLVDQGFSSVEVAGNFPGWNWGSQPMTIKDGVWTITITVTSPGTYEYKFITDGTWRLDPLNPNKNGTPPLDNSVVLVERVKTCDEVSATRCNEEGKLEVCEDMGGCPAWQPASDPCTDVTKYCEAGECHAIQSPVVTDKSVTFTVRYQGYPVEVAGDFTTPLWEVFIPLVPAPGRLSVTINSSDYPGLTPGQHQYKFRVPTTQLWFHDPANPDKVDDGQGGFNSVFTIPDSCVSDCQNQDETQCKDENTMKTCIADRDGCLKWGEQACNTPTYCLRNTCENIPVINASTKTVTFLYKNDSATAVLVAGSFTTPEWDKGVALVMSKSNGLWSATATVQSGTYRYKFIVNPGPSETWVHDPYNPNKEPDGYNGFNSVFVIP